jgi:hypothetical protein
MKEEWEIWATGAGTEHKLVMAEVIMEEVV